MTAVNNHRRFAQDDSYDSELSHEELASRRLINQYLIDTDRLATKQYPWYSSPAPRNWRKGYQA